ncbi:MAG: DUF4139 domain-containing protein [Pseudomonadales bacterium]|nr:DUF4139 domain-containing protein [Pseudomonadales bacterium]
MNPATGIEKEQRATLLSTNNGTVVKIGDRIETNPPGRYIFDNVPANLRDKPTLSVMLDNKTPRAQDLQLSYLTAGLSWRADYVAELNQDDNRIDLNGWVTLNNTSGTSYNNAQMQLVAGDVNIVRDRMHPRMRNKMVAMEMTAQADSSMREEALFEYHLYTLQRPTTIRDKQKKQVSLLTASNVPVKKELVLQGNNYYYRSASRQIGEKLKFGVYVELENEKKNGLGLPLPKGIVRVYKRDSNESLQFIGEDSISHTPNKDKLRLRLGEAFDVVANKKQTAFKINERALGRDTYDSSYVIEVSNGKKEAVEVIIREPIPGDWKILQESSPHKKVAAHLAQWRLQVPAEGKATLEYSTRVK